MTGKLIMIILVAFVAAGFAYADEFELDISVEMRTGAFWQQIHTEGEGRETVGRMHNNDNAGYEQGRLSMLFHMRRGAVGARVMFEQDTWAGAGHPIRWPYAFAYGVYLEDQFRVSIGRLGESPWAAGGDIITDELDNEVGIRMEFMPNFLPGLGVGFVINRMNNRPAVDDLWASSLGDLLSESVIGITYTNEFFHGRFGWRLDSDIDGIMRTELVYDPNLGFYVIRDVFYQEGHEFMYRLEPRILSSFVPGLTVSLNGWWRGVVGDNIPDDLRIFQNWLDIEYAPEAFTAELALGLEFLGTSSHSFEARAGFYYNFLPILSAGSGFVYNYNFGSGREIRGASYRFIGVEPQIRVTVGTAYVALVYHYRHEFVPPRNEFDPTRRNRNTHWINLRTVIAF